MKLNVSNREIFRNIRKALKLGLPVAGLLAGNAVAQPQPPSPQNQLPKPEPPNAHSEKINVFTTTGEVAPARQNLNVRNEDSKKMHRTKGKMAPRPPADNRPNEQPIRTVTDGMVPRPIPQGTPPAVMDPVKTHRVRRGETLSGIARRYGLSLDEIRRLNGILPQDGDRIREGRLLVVSQPRPPAPPANRVHENKPTTPVPPGMRPLPTPEKRP